MTKTEHSTTEEPTRYAGIFRRLFAIFYDSFLLIAILFSVSAIATAINSGKAVEPGDTLYPIFVIIIFGLSYLYFAWFWIHGGQSLGMKTWQIKLQSDSNDIIDWKVAAIRFVSAIISWGILGLGFLWAIFDSKNRSWHDFASDTVLIDLRKK